MRSAAALQAELSLFWQPRPPAECVVSGCAELDALSGGLPRGSITEIHGPAGAGRTSLLAAILAQGAARGEVCALVDSSDCFDPASAAAAGVELSGLLWVRCGGNPEHALKAVDLLIHAGGFGVVALDLGDVAPQIARRIPLASWFRLRRAIENTPAVLVVVEREQTLKTCASLAIEMSCAAVNWSGAPGCSRLLRGAELSAALPEARRKPTASERQAGFQVRASG